MPRLQNEEADALSNGDFRHFAAMRRIPVDLQNLPLGILPELLDKGEDYLQELESLKAADKAWAVDAVRRGLPVKGGKRHPGQSLRERAPCG